MLIELAQKKYNIPQIAQYDNVRLTKDFRCMCSQADFSKKYSYKIIGFVDTQQGYMIVCECPKCFEQYRHHIGTTSRYNLESFKKELRIILHFANK